MTTIGMIGGMSWESTLEYYRLVNQAVKERCGGLHSAPCLIHSVDFHEVEILQRESRWEEAGALLVDSARSLERGGAGLLILCTNTMHKAADRIEEAISIPFLHIADATAEAVRAAGIRKVGLLGTRFTMEEEFYAGRLRDRHGLSVIVPDEHDRQTVHRVIYEELCLGVVDADSRDEFLRIIGHLERAGAEGVILGCTEIGLLVGPGADGTSGTGGMPGTGTEPAVPLFDTTRIHARTAVEFALRAPETRESELFRVEPIPGSAEEVRLRHEENRAAWNEGAAAYAAEIEPSRAFLASGRSNLHPVERRNLERYGPLASWCNRAIHLQCAGGRDTLSLAVEGAREVIGVDISDRMIESARALAEAAGIPATFHRCDVLDTPHELDSSADLVYTGRGALCWIQDIDAWARVVARLLRPGGIVSVYEGHPVQALLDENRASLAFAPGARYFGFAVADRGWPDTYIGRVEGLAPHEESWKHERSWTLAEVIQAVIDAGLTVEMVGEHPEDFWEAFPLLPRQERERIPNTFSLCARKARG